jgi:hypothetical protein
MNIPKQGLIYWSVGNGDSTTVLINENLLMQVDLNDMEKADDKGDPCHPVIDHLVAILPKVGNKPYLAAFVLTHPDEDHCNGFKELLKRVNIGELWFTPRTFLEYHKDLCDDAKAFKVEAMRRIALAKKSGGELQSGDRIRVVGYHEVLEKTEYSGIPEKCLSEPGHNIVVVDGNDLGGKFHAHIHAPFKDSMEDDRNDTSLAMQIGVGGDTGVGQALFFGDLAYEHLIRIFNKQYTDYNYLSWNVLLSPHHCSKSAMYVREDGKDKLKDDILQKMNANKKSKNYIIASSYPVPDSNKEGEDPPHAKARDRYTEITNQFICTGEYGSEDAPVPIMFEITKDGFTLFGTLTKASRGVKTGLGAAATAAREAPRVASQITAFGKR